MKPRNRRLTTLWFVGGAALFLLAVTVAGLLLEERAMETDFSRQNLAPSLAAPFGTDWMGRDMLARVLVGGQKSGERGSGGEREGARKEIG